MKVEGMCHDELRRGRITSGHSVQIALDDGRKVSVSLDVDSMFYRYWEQDEIRFSAMYSYKVSDENGVDYGVPTEFVPKDEKEVKQ